MPNLLILAQAQAVAAPPVDAPPVAPLLALLVFGVALLLLLILRFRLQAFLALLVASIAVAVGATFVGDQIALTEVASTIVAGMGSALGFIATIIGVGAIFGAVLEHSGGAQSLAHNLIRFFGQKRAPWAMLLTGFIVSIPVFLDVALVILAPILYALARDTKKSLLYFGLPLVAGLGVTHAFVPPTPGPVFVAYILGVNLGWVILFGLMVGLPTALVTGPWLCRRLADRVPVELPEHEREAKAPRTGPLPGLGLILTLIVLPIALILTGTIVEQVVSADIPQGLAKAQRDAALAEALRTAPLGLQSVYFLGQPVIALLLTTMVTLYFLGTRRGMSKQQLLEISTRSLGPAGIIILITGAGGVFKEVLGATGIDDALRVFFSDSGIPIVLLAWVFATLVRIAQGSATVAMLTAAGLMASLVSGLTQPQLALVTVAIAAGATGFSHLNDSGFWIISRYFGMTEKQTLKTWTVVSIAISLVGFTFTAILWTII